jgi:hypothetical protein
MPMCGMLNSTLSALYYNWTDDIVVNQIDTFPSK